MVVRADEGGGMPQFTFMSVADAAAAGGIPRGSPLATALNDVTAISPCQAVEALGEAVHGVVGAALVRRLQDTGAIPATGVTYASAFSGIDVIAGAVHEATGGDWSHRMASEPVKCRRRVMATAWGPYGLSTERTHQDARSDAACLAESVDLFAITPVCQPFSPRNHERSRAKQLRALADTHAALDYVRIARPRAVIVENVNAPEVVQPIDGILGRIPGYAWLKAIVDPRDLGAASARTRCFWVGTRVGPA